jgi:hypothetical protein
MSVIWEDPPSVTGNRAARFGRAASPLRKEADDILETLRSNQGQWARVWDMPSKEEARKRSNYIGTKFYSFSVRETDHGWSVYGRFNGEPDPQPEPAPDPEDPTPVPAPEPVPEMREPTFQE